MGRRKPRLTKKRVEGLWVAVGLLEGSLCEYSRDDPEYAELFTATQYLQELYFWYESKHEGLDR